MRPSVTPLAMLSHLDDDARAIEQLGNADSIDVHLGGIYSLERIAKDSPDDRVTVFEVLCAFV